MFRLSLTGRLSFHLTQFGRPVLCDTMESADNHEAGHVETKGNKDRKKERRLLLKKEKKRKKNIYLINDWLE